VATLYVIRNTADPDDVRFAEGKVAARQALDAVRESAARQNAYHLGARVDYEMVAAADILSESALTDLVERLEAGGVAPANREE
jgi:hypothetical protein